MTTIGLDLGGTKCLGLAVGADGAVVAEHREPTPRGGERVVDVLESVARTIARMAGLDPAATAVGVGVPGLVDPQGVLRDAPNLREAAGTSIAGSLAGRLGGSTRVTVDNDVNCAMAAEWSLGAARGADDALLVALGTGIGGAIVAGGVLQRGVHGFAGEIGHMVVDTHGPPCPCGRRGCWERYASGSGLGRMGRDAAAAGRAAAVAELAGGDPDDVRGEHVTAAAAGGDADALEVIAEFAAWLGLGLANLANLLDPGIILIGGGVVEESDLFLGPARAAFAEQLPTAGLRTTTAILPAALGERAGAIGAAVLARRLTT